MMNKVRSLSVVSHGGNYFSNGYSAYTDILPFLNPHIVAKYGEHFLEKQQMWESLLEHECQLPVGSCTGLTLAFHDVWNARAKLRQPRILSLVADPDVYIGLTINLIQGYTVISFVNLLDYRHAQIDSVVTQL